MAVCRQGLRLGERSCLFIGLADRNGKKTDRLLGA